MASTSSSGTRGSDIGADNHPVTCDIGTIVAGQPIPLNSVSLSLILTIYCHVAPLCRSTLDSRTLAAGRRRDVFKDS